MVLTRLEGHLENTDQLAHTLIGFRKHVCTEGAALMTHEEEYATPSAVELRTIVEVDIKTFDNVVHIAVMQNLAETIPGCRVI